MKPVKLVREWEDRQVMIEWPDGETRFLVRSIEAEHFIQEAWGDLVAAVFVDPDEPAVVPGNPECGVAALLPDILAIRLFTGQILLMSGRGMEVYKTNWTFQNS